MTDEEIVNTIKNGKTIKEIFDAWNYAASDPKRLYRLHSQIEETMIKFAMGKDPRFPYEEIEAYINTPKELRK